MTAFEWACPDVHAAAPTIQTFRGPLDVIHPLADRDDQMRNRSERSNVCDVFNLNRRPGAIYLVS